MKTNTLSILLVFFIAGCASYTDFPVSNIAPAATIKVKEKKDKNENTVVSVMANNLASAERLDKKVFVVWITTRDNGTKNIGQLKHENAKKSSLETTTAFDPVEVFITAEDQGNISYPSNFEISRVALENQNESSVIQ